MKGGFDDEGGNFRWPPVFGFLAAREEDAPIAVARISNPHFAPVQNPLVAFLDGAGLNVVPGVGPAGRFRDRHIAGHVPFNAGDAVFVNLFVGAAPNHVRRSAADCAKGRAVPTQTTFRRFFVHDAADQAVIVLPAIFRRHIQPPQPHVLGDATQARFVFGTAMGGVVRQPVFDGFDLFAHEAADLIANHD